LEIQYSKSAMKSIKEMNNPYKSRIKTAIEKIPQGDIRKLQGYNNMYRLRIGDYRIIYKTTENGIYIDGVLPRGEAYKRL
jgi:mRNA interferase RelE/StbE